MSFVAQPTFDEESGIDLRRMIAVLWRRKVLVIVCALVAGLITVAIALASQPYYRAEVVVTDVRDRGLGGAGSLAAQLGGLATLAGVNITPGAAGAAAEAAAVLDSNHLAEEFIRRSELLPVLLKGSKQPPSMWKAVQKFKLGVVTIRKDTRRGVTTVQMEWTDAASAARWANSYVALANEIIRARAIDESTRNIDYLNDQIAKTNVVELRKVMYDIIESETKTLMLARGRIEYAFEVVDPAVPPEVRARPHRTIMVLIGTLLGFFVGAVAALAVDYLSRLRRTSQSASEPAENAAR